MIRLESWVLERRTVGGKASHPVGECALSGRRVVDGVGCDRLAGAVSARRTWKLDLTKSDSP